MSTRSNARQNIVDTAATLLRRRGFAATGLNEIVEVSGAPKGSLYHYFPQGKSAIAADALLASGKMLGSTMTSVLDRAEGSAQGMQALADLFAQMLTSSDFLDGCPVATVALEVSATNEQIRGASADVYTAWARGLAHRMNTWGVPEDRSADAAELVLASFQGALLLARVHQDVSIIRRVADQLGRYVTRL